MLPTMAIKVFPVFLIRGVSTFISGVLPLLEMQITTSSGWIMPKSPWMASAACIKMAGVPVELKVETILLAMLALFPMPVIITLPLAKKSVFTASGKLLSNSFPIFSIAFFSQLKT